MKALHALMLVSLALPALAQGPIFPEPFEVEHRFVQTDADGSVFQGEPVIDRYGGSWVVSERSDGSRLILDFARRELTEVNPAAGTHSSLGFERFAELRRRYAAATGPSSGGRGTEEGEPADLEIEPLAEALQPKSFDIERSEGFSIARPGEAPVELWVDRRFVLSKRALEALADFDETLDSPVAEHLELGRRRAGGAFVVSSLRPIDLKRADSGTQGDEVLRIERLERLSLELIAIPEGSRRIPHKLEGLVAWAEEEARIDHLLAGGGR